MSPEAKNPQGFTLPELLFSLAIMAMVILTLFSLAASSLRSNEKSSHLAAGEAVAETQLEHAIRNAQADIPTGDKDRFWGNEFPSSGAPFKQDQVRVGKTDFQYAIYATTLIERASGLPVGGDVLLENRIKRVECVVWWLTDSASGARQGFGDKLRTTASRLVNEEPDEV